MAVAVVLTVATGLDYVRQAVVVRRAGLAAERAAAAAEVSEVSEARAAAADVLRLLDEHGWTLAVAESLTGGLVAAELAGVSGASRSFRGSVTAYATPLKHELLGVDATLLAARGAVDPEVAR